MTGAVEDRGRALEPEYLGLGDVAVLAVAVKAQEERVEPAVIGRITDGKLLLDLRSVMPREDGALTTAIAKARA